MKLPAIFGDHMVLRRDQKDRVWGWADPGEEVTVTIKDQSKTAKAGPDGKWQVTLDPLPTGGPYTMTVKGKITLTFSDVLAGEVWICSGQSNMQMSVAGSNDADLEIRAANFPGIRLITVPNRGTQEPQKDFGSSGSCVHRRGVRIRGRDQRPQFPPPDPHPLPSSLFLRVAF